MCTSLTWPNACQENWTSAPEKLPSPLGRTMESGFTSSAAEPESASTGFLGKEANLSLYRLRVATFPRNRWMAATRREVDVAAIQRFLGKVANLSLYRLRVATFPRNRWMAATSTSRRVAPPRLY